MWPQIDISLNNTLISQSSNAYPYTSYLHMLTSYDNKSHYTYLRSAGYLPYNSDKPDSVNEKLASLTNRSKTFKLYGRIFNELFEVSKYLINGVSMQFNFIYSSDTFALMGSPLLAGVGDVAAISAPTPKLKIIDACLFVRHVKLSPPVFNAINKAIIGSNAIYPIKRRNSFV